MVRTLTLMCILVLPLTAEASPWVVPPASEIEMVEIKFEADDGAVLSGTLRIPKGTLNGPAVIIPQQTRTETRDNSLYVQTAEVFNAVGYSAFNYDRRGKGKSGGDLPRTNYIRLAKDAVSAKNAVAEMDAVDPMKIGYWGLSQSGWISMEAAAISDPAFVIIISSPLTTPGRQMEIFVRNSVLVDGYSEEAARQAMELRHAIMDRYMRGKISHDTARALIKEAESEPWFERTMIPTAESLPEDVSNLGWLNEMDYNPIDAYEAIEAPLLFILGGHDWVIPVQETLELLDTAEPNGPREVYVIPSAEHEMRIEEEARFLTEEEVAEREPKDFNPDSIKYFMIMGNWLGRMGPQ